MLRLTKKADYGLMALKYLAEHPNQPSLSARDIAQAYHIPPQLLAKILQRLAKVGILQSARRHERRLLAAQECPRHLRL